MIESGAVRGRGRFRAISTYVHATHVLLAVGTIVAPAAAFVIEPQSPTTVLTSMIAATLVCAGASCLVAVEFIPFSRATRWLRERNGRSWVRIGVLAAALAIVALAPPAEQPDLAVAIPLAWALVAVSYGSFWTGLLRLALSTLFLGAVAFGIDLLAGVLWDPVTLIVAALLALGVLGQDSIYTLAIELDELRTHAAEHAVASERNRFAGDLHDVQGQHLGLIAVEAELVSRLIDRGDYAAAASHADRVQAITVDALEEMHRVVHANRHVRLAEEIINAGQVLRSAGISVEYDIVDTTQLGEDADRLLGLTVREGITNILKHTRASSCAITLKKDHRHGVAGITLLVSNPSAAISSHGRAELQSPGTGLSSLAARYLRGSGELKFTQNGHSRLAGWLPLDSAFTGEGRG